MAISKKPTRRNNKLEVTSDMVQSVINKGGSSPKQEISNILESKRKGYPLRLYPFTFDEIKNSVESMQRRRKRKPNFSMHKWIEEAIDEKLQHEKEESDE